LITAERIEAFGGAIRIFKFAKIARLLVVIENYCLVEFGKF